MISLAGTCWSAMAVMAALPRAERPPAPVPPAITAAETQPWMETALFGSATGLRTMLDNGLNPNSRTAGGVTLLMFAAPDAAKVKLLIERGANVKAKAQSGYTALTVAAMYRGTAESIKLLLAAGAEAAPGTGVMFNASPLFLAAMAGDVENVALLRAKGADPKRPMVLMGVFSNSPLFVSTVYGEPQVMKAVLAAGGDLRETDQDGMTALHWAALSPHPEAASVLAAAGAPLNQPDKHGFTPLMYAASIDYGNAEMVKALLAAGGDRSVKTKDGKTALSQAKQLHYTHIVEALETPRK
jgi:ankyrin repeat protein